MVPATIFDWLDGHTGASTAILTAALVLITAYYAYKNREMVREMQKTRNAAILPRLALEFIRLAPVVIELEIRNVGPGAALDVDIRTYWEPIDAKGATEGTRYRRNVLSPGEQIVLFPPGELNGNLDSIPALFREVRIVGTMTDAAGARHEIDDRFSDLAEWREIMGNARERWEDPDRSKQLADALLRKFERPLRDLTAATKDVARAVHGLAPPTDDGD